MILLTGDVQLNFISDWQIKIHHKHGKLLTDFSWLFMSSWQMWFEHLQQDENA